MLNPYNYEIEQLARDMHTECRREIQELEGLKEHVEGILERMKGGSAPSLNEIGLLVLMKNALVNHQSLMTAVKEQGKTYWDKAR